MHQARCYSSCVVLWACVSKFLKRKKEKRIEITTPSFSPWDINIEKIQKTPIFGVAINSFYTFGLNIKILSWGTQHEMSSHTPICSWTRFTYHPYVTLHLHLQCVGYFCYDLVRCKIISKLLPTLIEDNVVIFKQSLRAI